MTHSMSSWIPVDVSGSAARVRRALERAGRVVFGNRIGFGLFLGTLCFLGLYWRAGVFITDTETLIATLDALSEGRLWIEPAAESSFQAPGAVVADGYVYGRNYGQLLASLPVRWLLGVLESVATLRVALTALWHLCALWFVAQIGHVLRARRAASLLGAPIVLASFLLNLSLARQFAAVSRSLLALQIVTMLATAMLAVVVFRLVTRRYEPLTGVSAGVASVAVLPVGFWAGLPKRHVLVALLLVGILYAFARSREPAALRVPLLGTVPGFRALAYVLVGLLAWIHAAEAIFALLALALVDVPTAPSNDRTSLAFVVAAFALSLAPALVTNVLISGDPSTPPRMLTPANLHSVSSGAGGLSGRFDVGGTTGLFLVDQVLRVGTVVGIQLVEGATATLDPDRFVQTWVRSGATDYLGRGKPEFAGTNLAVLEAVPLFGGFVVVLTFVRSMGADLRGTLGRIEPTDALAVALTAAFVLLYAKRLPVHVQVTVRYLLPTYPLMLYLLVRIGPVRTLWRDHRRSVLWTYVAAVLLGSQVLLAGVVATDATVARASQFHAHLGLGLAAFLAVTLLAARVDDRAEPVAAVALALAAAAGTAFVLLSGFAYFSFVGEHVLPVADAISDVIGRI